MHKISYVTQGMINCLYTNMKNIFINPAKNTGIYYTERKYNLKHNVRKRRRHCKQVWYNDECEVLRKNVCY